MKFSRLLVVEQSETIKGRRRWKCVCDCGKNTVVDALKLKNGHTKSCGCFALETRCANGRFKKKHGHNVNDGNTKLSRTWAAIKSRCYNKKTKGYQYYGGRGVKVCDRWLHSFENFVFDMGEPENNNMQIDRINTNGHYEPANCRWVNSKENAMNRRYCKQATLKRNCDHSRESFFLFCPLCGIEFADVDFQVANGGGAPTSPEGVLESGAKAGVMNG